MSSLSHEFIYLDHCATTPVDPRVLQSMLPYFSELYGNASSVYHKLGRKSAEAVDRARSQVAKLINASSKEITFTSGATEAINQTLKGVFYHYQHIGKHIITCASEHPAVLDTCNFLNRAGADITKLATNHLGEISLDDLKQAIRPDTILICLMLANNETGVLHPIKQISKIAKEHNILFFCDATQAVGKIPVNVESDGIDLLALSAHKIYGPKGVGALYIKRRRAPIQVGALIQGGKQENNLRAGTLNVPGIVGLGEAAELAFQSQNEESKRLEQLRDCLEASLLTLPETFVNGNSGNRLPHVSNMCFRYIRGADIMTQLPQLALSAGAACASGSRAPSHVLLAMGLSKEDAESSLRFSLGRTTTKEQINYAVDLLRTAITKLRKDSPVWKMYESGLL
ncbi:cysteine desulfurase family protein [Olivibacter sp. XZL3]|uniref:cysteine desulfurase family protein n=1 Tax=Olivibacter sp. XZL3 TaxID=1735116 RepID=UPI0010651919|nr:cysteine desulfurase family protein [Olivibacter sp. XZL3]